MYSKYRKLHTTFQIRRKILAHHLRDLPCVRCLLSVTIPFLLFSFSFCLGTYLLKYQIALSFLVT